MEYKIVIATQSFYLEEEINKLIKDGWVPQGGVIYLPEIWYQAMIRKLNTP